MRSVVVSASALSLLALPTTALATPYEDAPPSAGETTTSPTASVEGSVSAEGTPHQSEKAADTPAGTSTDTTPSGATAELAGQSEGTPAPAASPASSQAHGGAQSADAGNTSHASAQATSAIISAPRAADGEVMNYAINLAPEASPEQLAQLVSAAKALGAATLAEYPDLDAFFAQSAKAAFASDLNAAAQQAGIPLHSVGPTRFAQVKGAEVVVSGGVHNGANGGGAGGAGSNSQVDDYVPDPRTSEAWGLTATGAVEAQKVDVPRAKVTVAVLDTGVDGNHVDLDDQIDVENSVGCHVNGIANNSRAAWQDDHYHGTHVAGTIAAEHNGEGVDGVAPSARIMAVKASNAEGLFYPEYVTCGVMWALAKGADITNNSYYVDPWSFWVPTEPSQAAGYEVVRRAFAYTNDQGLLHVVAAGNADYNLDNPSTDSSSPNDVEGAAIKDRDVSGGVDIPAMLDSVVTVSSIRLPSRDADPATVTFQRSGFSNYGEKHIEVTAPGSGILSTFSALHGGGWRSISGTSMASPHAAGVAALLKSIHPDAKAPRLRELLLKQAAHTMNRLAEDANAKAYRGHGLVNALDAVLKDQPTPVVGDLEYSIDGGNTWQPVGAEYNVNRAQKARLRVSITGPVTKASLKVFDFPVASAHSTEAFGEDLVVTTEELALADALAAHDGEFLSVPVTVSAEGRNRDPRADDDVVEESKLALVKKEIVPHPDNLKVEVSASSVKPGESLTFSATGFAIGEDVTFTVYSDPVTVGTVAANQEGQASTSWTVPADFPVGTHTVKALGTSGRQATQTFEVTTVKKPDTQAPSASGDAQKKPPSAPTKSQSTSTPSSARGGLASTGAQVSIVAALALVAVLVGAAGVAARRRG